MGGICTSSLAGAWHRCLRHVLSGCQRHETYIKSTQQVHYKYAKRSTITYRKNKSAHLSQKKRPVAFLRPAAFLRIAFLILYFSAFVAFLAFLSFFLDIAFLGFLCFF